MAALEALEGILWVLAATVFISWLFLAGWLAIAFI